MGRMYTLDDKLLCSSPEIRIGDKIFPIDDRQKTVKKALKLFKESDTNSDEIEKIEELFQLAFGKNFPEIEEMDLSFAAYQELAIIIISAMTGEDQEDIKKKKEKKDSSFPGEPAGDVV